MKKQKRSTSLKHKKSLSISNYWLNKAVDLQAAARCLYHMEKNEKEIASSIGFPNGYSLSKALPWVTIMIAGLSIEVMLKALLVRKNAAFKGAYETHNLATLARQADLTFTVSQTKTLKAFQEAVIWYGKYPIPKLNKIGIVEDNFLDDLWTKVNPQANGFLGKIVKPDPDTWPSEVNYLKIWNKIHEAYCKIKATHPEEFHF